MRLHGHSIHGLSAGRKTIEKQIQLHLVFVDLCKTYNSVPHEALLAAVKELGVSDLLVDVIRSFHNHMKARIRVDEELLEEIEVENGPKQGCNGSHPV